MSRAQCPESEKYSVRREGGVIRLGEGVAQRRHPAVVDADRLAAADGQAAPSVDREAEDEPGHARLLAPGPALEVDAIELAALAAGPEHARGGVPGDPLGMVEPVDEDLSPLHGRPLR